LTSNLTHQLIDLLGADSVLTVAGSAVDGVEPQAVAQPAGRPGVAKLLRWASANGVRVFPRGGGVFTGLGNTPSRVDVALDLSRLNRVVDYQPADLTVTAEAGITLETLRQELARGDKYVPLEAPLPHRATVGGVLATGHSGPMRYFYGLPRDWLIGISVVGTDGVETKAGGRVVKNVTGYDLNKLYTGSLGTLSVTVEATFKLAPIPDSWAGVTAAFPSLSAAVAASRALVSEVYAPLGLQVVSAPVAAQLGLDLPGSAAAAALGLVAGRPRAVARRRDESARLLGESRANHVAIVDDTGARSLLSLLTDLSWNDASPPELALKVTLPPDNVGKLLESLGCDGNGNAAWDLVADPGFGTVQLLRWASEPDRKPDSSAIMADIAAVRRASASLGGATVVEICPPEVKAGIDVWQGVAGPVELEIMRRIKHNFDPAGVLNPGRFVGGL
jgi:glycolate oxidase FAD binding subunit